MREKKISDYLHLYIGCKLERGGIVTHNLLAAAEEAAFDAYLDFKPILRPISSMTKEEAIEVTKPVVAYGDIPNRRVYITYKNSFGDIIVSWGEGIREKYSPTKETAFSPQQFHYLLSKHFDLFNLIEDDLAIAAPSSINKQP